VKNLKVTTKEVNLYAQVVTVVTNLTSRREMILYNRYIISELHTHIFEGRRV
jgi:hypothetical protein